VYSYDLGYLPLGIEIGNCQLSLESLLETFFKTFQLTGKGEKVKPFLCLNEYRAMETHSLLN
jgi:hypothetical protein